MVLAGVVVICIMVYADNLTNLQIVSGAYIPIMIVDLSACVLCCCTYQCAAGAAPALGPKDPADPTSQVTAAAGDRVHAPRRTTPSTGRITCKGTIASSAAQRGQDEAMSRLVV